MGAQLDLLGTGEHPLGMVGAAYLSPCGRYRYALTRRWGPGARVAVFCCLNPSTADASADDPSLKRMMGFARREGADGIAVVNLYAWRSTDPAALADVEDPIGPENDDTIAAMAKGAGLVIAGWGGSGPKGYQARARAVLGILRSTGTVYCLGTTAGGQPRHPLYLAANTPLSLLASL